MRSNAKTGLLLLALTVAGCGARVDVAALPRSEDVLQSVGKRLGTKLSPDKLESIGSNEATLLAHLTATERDALARGYLKFRVDQPVVISVAFTGTRPPFWLTDQGFQKTSHVLSRGNERFNVWSRDFVAGTIGLGVNSLDRSATGHYITFVRGPASGVDVEVLDKDRATSVPVVTDLSPYSDDAQPFDALPAELSGSIVLQPRRDARHAMALVHSKVWKTRVPSSKSPDQVVVGFGADAARSLTWTWRTDSTVKASEVALESLDGSTQQLLKSEFLPIDSFGLLNDPVIHRHRAHVEGLTPDTSYRYRIRDTSIGDWTAWHTVKTGPDTDRDFTFLSMGDPQCGLEEWGTLLETAHSRHPDAGLLVIAGDLVDRGNERSNWDHFFLRAAGVFDTLPMMPAVGNHEYLDRGPVHFERSFLLPANGPQGIPHGLTYAFHYANAFIAVLDSNPAVYSSAKAEVIGRWLDDQLTRTKATWKLVVFHHPVYPSHPKRATPQLANAWIPIFDKHAVDLVIQGHDHAYLRTYPLRGNQSVAGGDRGTVYVVSVSGQKFVPIADRPYTAKGFADVATYEVIDISPRNGTLKFRSMDVEGVEHDAFELRKHTPLVDQRATRDVEVQRSVFDAQKR